MGCSTYDADAPEEGELRSTLLIAVQLRLLFRELGVHFTFLTGEEVPGL